jgi:hypothetical protein
VEEPGEDVGADDQERVALLERAAHAGRRREQTTAPERVVAREAGAPIDRLAVDARAQELGQRGQLGHRAGAGHAVARDDDRIRGAGQELGGMQDRPGLGPALRGDRRRRRPGVVNRGAHQIHRHREEHRTGRRREGHLERAPQRDGGVLGPADLVAPLGELLGHPREVGGENRLVHEEARVLLSGRHHDGRFRPRGVVQDRQAVREAGRHVDVDDAHLPGRLRVAVGRRHRRGFLQAQDVLERRVGQGVEERQLGGAGIAEEVADTSRLQDFHQHARDIHGAENITSAAASASRDRRRRGTSRRWRRGSPAATCPRPSSASRHA